MPDLKIDPDQNPPIEVRLREEPGVVIAESDKFELYWTKERPDEVGLRDLIAPNPTVCLPVDRIRALLFAYDHWIEEHGDA